MIERARLIIIILALALAATSAASARDVLARGGRASDESTEPVTRMTPTGVEHPLLVQAQSGSTNSLQPMLVPGYEPEQLRNLLSLSGDGEGETIGIVVAFGHPALAEDINVFSATFALPLACGAPEADPADCFELVEITDPGIETDPAWALETALDVQWAHAIAPRARIVVVESSSDELPDMMRGISRAEAAGATVISNSWGEDEFSGERRYDRYCRGRVLCVFAAGNNGNPAAYPATSPYAIAVSGTTLSFDDKGDVATESAWFLAGGGVSAYEARPRYQSDAHEEWGRGVPDVSYHAYPGFGYAVYTSIPYNGRGGWFKVGGTSAGAPQWAAILAVANQLRVEEGKPRLSAQGYTAHRALYALAGSEVLFDVTVGENGECEHCYAGEGYDFVTGLGSPRGSIDVALAEY